MIEFISLVTQLSKNDFDDVRIENSEHIPLFYNDKIGRLDIKIRLPDGRKIDVEMSFSDRLPCLSENTSFVIRQNIAAAWNHCRPWWWRNGGCLTLRTNKITMLFAAFVLMRFVTPVKN